VGIRLNMVMSKLEAIETSIANFFGRLDLSDLRLWKSILTAVREGHTKNVSAGVSGDTVRIGVDNLPSVVHITSGREGDDDENEEDAQEEKSQTVSPVRRSSRRSKKAEKAQVADDVDLGEDEVDDEEDEEGNDAGKVGVEHKGDDKGKVESEDLREKKKSAYLPFDKSKHFYWAKSVRYCVLFLIFILTDSFT
jgi:hypothetical protein